MKIWPLHVFNYFTKYIILSNSIIVGIKKGDGNAR